MERLIKVCLLSLLMGCSGLEKGQQDTLRQSNAKASVVLRSHDEWQYVIEAPKEKPKPVYPWESE